MLKQLTFLFLALAIGLTGCSSSRVVLLDVDKAENAVVVKTNSGETVLDQPNTYTELSAFSSKPSAPRPIDQKEIEQRFGQLIETAPKPPIRFLLYFNPDSTVLTKTSENLFPKIEKAIKERAPCDVNIIGHADRTGSKEYNISLSLKRAHQVEKWLKGRQLVIANVAVESYGEEDPLIQTGDGVAEPKNRRVEILIR